MIENHLERIRGIVRVGEFLFSCVLVVFYVHIDLHFVVYMLLPIGSVLPLEGAYKRKHHKGEHVLVIHHLYSFVIMDTKLQIL